MECFNGKCIFISKENICGKAPENIQCCQDQITSEMRLPSEQADDVVEQSPEQKKMPKLRHGMNIKIGNELFKVYRASKKSVTLRYQGDA